MAVDRNIIEKRVWQALNMAPQNDDGTANYTNTGVPGDDGRAADDISDAVTQAGLRIFRTICNSLGSPHRGAFLQDIAVTDGQRLSDALPGYVGPPGRPLISPYSGAAFVVADMESKSVEEIESYRQNPLQLYSATNHNVATTDGMPSPLAGFCQIIDSRVFFTGNECQVPLAFFERDDVDTMMPDDLEDTWFRVSVGLCKKKGDGGWLTAIINKYGSEGERDLDMILAGARTVPPIEADQAQAAA